MLDTIALFNDMHPGFFEKEHIRNIPGDRVYEEMVLDLRAARPALVERVGDIRFGTWSGDIDALRAIVRRVEDGWPPIFKPGDEVYCGFDGDRIASFCLVEDMGAHQGAKFGGPGCVGTLPEYRRRGIGLRMVENVTRILQDRGYDYSYIHYTGVAPWYAKLGYRTILRWNAKGLMGE